MSQPFKILLYYKYVTLKQPKKIRKQQFELCERLNLKGRIIISDEGINGTLAGETADVDAYLKATEKITAFKNMEWKISYSDTQVFPKLSIKVRDEIVTLGVKKSGKDVAIKNKAHYIEPQELLELYEKNEDFLILDARNMYEAQVGKFKDALIPPIDNFREFPQFAEKIATYKDKEIVTYCTGGIRCEKASAYLREKGFKKVRQLHGGIHEYGEKAGGKYFEGELFVFDQRLHVPINHINPSVISECLYCHTKISRYVDCAEAACGELFICCETCQEKHKSACSSECEAKMA